MAANEFITQIIPVRNNNIVRVSTDSDKNLEELFRAVIGPKDCQFPLSKPMRQRNLPASFFTPPETGSKSASHSRESSIDQVKPYVKQILLPSQAKNIQIQQSQNGSNQHITQATPIEEQQLIINQQIQQQKISLLNRAGIQIVHPRAHSSPATLQQTLNVPLNNGNVANQQLNSAQQNSPQPAQNTPTTTQQTVQQADVTIQHIRQLSDINQIPLPEGWEQAVDQGSGRIYFINHNNKTTTWQDPRLATQQLKLLQLQQFEQQKAAAAQQQLQQQQIQQQIQFQQQAQQQQQLQQFQQPQQLLQQQQTIVLQNNNIILQNSPLSHQVNGKLPDGWEERKTEDGEIYYINHNNCTTSWFDPRIPIQLQKPNLLNANQINRPPPELNANDVNLVAALNNNSQNIIQNENLIQQNSNTNANHQNSSPQQLQTQQQIQQSQALVIQQQAQNIQHISHQQTMQNDHQLRVQQLQLECEKMRQRQQEIQNQQRLFTPNINDNNESVSPNHGISTTGMDPFLGGTLLTAESHSRQESADSGLGLCNNYSLPHTPEAMLDSDLDENNYVTTTEDLGLDSLAITSMDLGENMESDDLLPNLPDEISCPDIHLSDIDAILAGNSSSRDNWI